MFRAILSNTRVKIKSTLALREPYLFLLLQRKERKDRVSLGGPTWPGTPYVGQAGLDHRSACLSLGLKVYITILAPKFIYMNIYIYMSTERRRGLLMAQVSFLTSVLGTSF